jgi:hypothetical protein
MMHWIRRSLYVAAGILVLASTASAASVPLYDNLGATTDGQDGVADSALGPLANSFSTGATAVMLTDVKIKLVLVGEPRDELIPCELYLYKDNGGPGLGDLVQTLGRVPNEKDVGTKPVSVEFKSPGDFDSVTLAANTRYWIKLVDISGNRDSRLAWCWSSDTSGTGLAKEYYSDKTGVTANNDTIFGPYQMLVIGHCRERPCRPGPSRALAEGTTAPSSPRRPACLPPGQ